MLELKGKYGDAKVFTDNIDQETISQVIGLLNQPYAAESKIRIMPDCHAGSGCVIGTTMTLADKVVPNLVGVDIGCGMYALQLEETDIDLSLLDAAISQYVPAGFNIHEHPIATSNVDKVLAPVNVDKAMCSLGTLGGGNHFIEVDRDTNGNLWLVIHTGSRHLGVEICNYYQELGYKALKASGSEEKIQEIVARLKAEGRPSEIESEIKKFWAQKPSIPKELSYVTGKIFDDYLHDMELAQEHAWINREVIAIQILQAMDLHVTDSFQTVHNYIDTKNRILRKGSISAQSGEKVLIPLNMRDCSLICIGQGNPDWNYSAPHGAGRILSRSKAKDAVSMDDFKDSMSGIYSTSVTESTIDESPFVYKPMDEIMRNVKDTVEIVERITPIYNFKAH